MAAKYHPIGKILVKSSHSNDCPIWQFYCNNHNWGFQNDEGKGSFSLAFQFMSIFPGKFLHLLIIPFNFFVVGNVDHLQFVGMMIAEVVCVNKQERG